MRLLADYDWMFYPLIVDINNDFGRNDEKEINVSLLFNNGSIVEIDLLEMPYVNAFWFFRITSCQVERATKRTDKT